MGRIFNSSQRRLRKKIKIEIKKVKKIVAIPLCNNEDRSFHCWSGRGIIAAGDERGQNSLVFLRPLSSRRKRLIYSSLLPCQARWFAGESLVHERVRFAHDSGRYELSFKKFWKNRSIHCFLETLQKNVFRVPINKPNKKQTNTRASSTVYMQVK